MYYSICSNYYNLIGTEDYDSGPYAVTIPANMTIVPIDVAINNDNIYENNEEFYVIIDSKSLPVNIIVGTPNQTTVTIVDNDRE